ncbi:hypothetical protein GTU79_03420 [Sodalis ligni]|uniref:hypothetical protein n=1 Tax=Sodalis ligni TaxID=2697027 RepID=UPI00193F274B|nr:hypothetical protein [Sodalis ligni]QWA11860.1 hypothetical protein GTU79_03420 [Sodalis ligni]
MKRFFETKYEFEDYSPEKVRRLAQEVMQEIADKKIISSLIDIDIINHPERWPKVPNKSRDDFDDVMWRNLPIKERFKIHCRAGFTACHAFILRWVFNDRRMAERKENQEIFKTAFLEVTKKNKSYND